MGSICRTFLFIFIFQSCVTFSLLSCFVGEQYGLVNRIRLQFSFHVVEIYLKTEHTQCFKLRKPSLTILLSLQWRRLCFLTWPCSQWKLQLLCGALGVRPSAAALLLLTRCRVALSLLVASNSVFSLSISHMGGITILLRIMDLGFIQLSYILYFACDDDFTFKHLVFTAVTSSVRTVPALLQILSAQGTVEYIVEPQACLCQVNGEGCYTWQLVMVANVSAHLLLKYRRDFLFLYLSIWLVGTLRLN